MGASNKVVITGASSFIGYHLAQQFAGAGYDVTGTITRPLEDYRDIQRERLAEIVRSGSTLAPVDITDAPALDILIQEIQPSIWIHHAGWAEHYGSLDYDLTRAEVVNVAPLESLYRSLKANGCQGVIVTGSSAEYSDSDLACSESDACYPAMPYGLSKLAETIRAGQLAKIYNLPTRVARVFIPYGPLDAPGKLLSSVVKSLGNHEKIGLSPCTQKRDFLHVHDLAAGYLALADDLARPSLFDIFNLCSGTATRIKDLLLSIADIMRADTQLLDFGTREMRAGETPVSYGSAEKARKNLNWNPRPLAGGLSSYLLETGTVSR